MSETRALLEKISALRQRLEQAQGLVNEARTAAAAILREDGDPGFVLDQEVVSTGQEQDLALDASLRVVASEQEQQLPVPRQLSSRARRILERGKELLTQLRELAEAFSPQESLSSPLIALYRDTLSMMDTAMRTVALLPESITSQMHLCKGLEVTLEEVAGRVRTLVAGSRRQRHEEAQLDRLARLLSALHGGQTIDPTELDRLADELISETRACEPLRFLTESPEDPARFIAAHSLTVSRVLCRVVRHEQELRSRTHEILLAGLLHDVGMLAVPAEILMSSSPLDGEQMRLIEAHTLRGAQLVSGFLTQADELIDAVATHHERLDGTGYPDGLQENQIRPLSRLLAVCDVYAAMCCSRPHRPARATRTALADTLLLADQGQLDRAHAECLLALSFYPVGSIVELNEGQIAVVVATPTRPDLQFPSRPVVALLTDGEGQPLPRPCHVDLGETEEFSIIRPLSARERAELLTEHFPQWAA